MCSFEQHVSCFKLRRRAWFSNHVSSYLTSYTIDKIGSLTYFRSETDFTSLLVLFLLLLGRPSTKKPLRLRLFKSDRNEIWQECSSRKYACISWRSRIFEFTSHFQDGGHDVISRRNVLPPGDWTRSVFPAAMQQPAASTVPDLQCIRAC